MGSCFFSPTYYDIETNKAALNWLKRGASLGDVNCMFALGIIASMFGGGGGLGTIAPLPKINEKEPESTQNTDKGV